jgi:DNA mismatch repair ATPase MutS
MDILQKISFYKSRSDQYLSSLLKHKETLKYLAFFRVLSFVIFLIAIIISADKSNLLMVIVSALVFIPLFIFLIKLYNIIQYAVQHNQILRKINEDEVLRLEGSLDGFDPGLEYLDTDHPYHNDLDIFGRNSLYQLVNRSSTYWGKKTLAKWFSSKADKKNILSRQESVCELSEDIGWLQEFQATGMHYENKTDISDFLGWLESDDLLSTSKFYQVIRYISPILLSAILILTVFSIIPYHWFVGGIILNGFVLLGALSRVRSIHNKTSEAIKSMKGLETLIVMIEKASFQSPGLKKLRSVYAGNDVKVSSSIGALSRILQNLDNRSNQIYHIFNLFLLLDLHFSIAAEKWKFRQSGKVQGWFDAIGEMEGLTSFAGMTFSNPHFIFPGILDGEHIVNAKNIGHPLIPHTKRISNDFLLEGKGHISMITGSNMAGKSTFLRTIGINMVLAFAGGPVCAEFLSLTPTQIFTSMRTQDNLEENISSFYAELKRICQLLEITDHDEPVFFLLDEILKGTNSHDRHLGAVSLVHQLSLKNISGLISTHDLDLARETSSGHKVTNYSFNSTIQGNEILFDYTLTPGICESFNASKLMKKMGIHIIE